MRHGHTRLVSAVVLCFGLAVAPPPPARGQNVAQPAWRGHLALASRGPLGLASPGYGAVLASQVVQGDFKSAPAPSGMGDSPATAEAPQEPAPGGGGPLQPVTVEHQGRLLVLTYGPKPTPGALMSFAGPRGEPPQFAVYQGQRQIASGQFEYG
jgi:hypothetical protein